jgi:hypothetical protein
MADTTVPPPAPKSWSLADMLEAVKAKAPKMVQETIQELRARARNREKPKLPDVDSLKSALGRIVEAIEGKPLGKQQVVVGQFADGRKRYGYKQYYANVAVRDAIAVGMFLESKRAHDERTRALYDGALKAKWGGDAAPWYVQQLVDELFHMLQVAQMAGA